MRLLLAMVALMAAGCGGEAPAGGSSAAADSAAAPSDAADTGHDAHAEAPATDSASPEDHAHAATGEGRALLPIMQELGARMTALTHGLMIDSAQLVASNAAAMAEHAPISAEEIERIRAELGADMAEFERIDGAVHSTLVRLHDAATAGRTDEVLTQLNEAQRGCVACHDAFRERLRTNVAR
jgi:hypothetical protein